MDRYEARKVMVEELKEQGLLVKVADHVHNVGTHDRCGTTVEPMIKQQWFVKMEEMAKPAIEAVKNGDLTFVPERFDKTYLHWLENIRDWCISRQLWWGHRIPAYYCDDCGEIVVDREMPSSLPEVRRNPFHTGSGYPGYLVLLCAVAFLYPGLAGEHRGSGLLLSNRRTGNRIRYHLLLGNPYGILRL